MTLSQYRVNVYLDLVSRPLLSNNLSCPPGQLAPPGISCPPPGYLHPPGGGGVRYPSWFILPPGGEDNPTGLSCPPGVKITQLGYLAPPPRTLNYNYGNTVCKFYIFFFVSQLIWAVANSSRLCQNQDSGDSTFTSLLFL